MASKKAPKGKRYTDSEKKQILEFVQKTNTEKGRGGATAAAKKFGVSQLTIGAWMKRAGGGTEEKRAAGKSGSRSGLFDQLAALDREITGKRKELAALEAKFEKLKAKI